MKYLLILKYNIEQYLYNNIIATINDLQYIQNVNHF